MKSILLHLKIVFIFIAVFVAASPSLFSQNKGGNAYSGSSWTVKPFERKAFIENKGQFDNNLPADKKSFKYCIDKGYQVFFYADEICYRLTRPVRVKETLLNKFESEEKREAREHEYKMEAQLINVKWLNANPNATIEAENKQSTVYSYTVNSKNEKPYTVMCEGYSKLIYKNLYDNIDVEYIFHPDKGIEYSLLIHPGADISQVKMQYCGVNNNFLNDGNVTIKTIAGALIDHAPVTFYAGSKEKITSSFYRTNNIVSFNVSSYLKDQEIIIDPWTVVPGFAPNQAFDNGVDGNGNIYIYGGAQGNFVVEKYNAAGGAPIWSLANSLTDPNDLGGYYGDLLVESSGNFYLSQGFVTSGAHTFKYSPTSSLIWQSTIDPNYQEHWRLALNCITNKVIVAGGGTTSPTLNIAEVDVNTGVLINALSMNATHEDMAGLCIDETGKSYLAGANSNQIFYGDNTNNVLATAANGYNLAELAIGGPVSYYSRDGFGEAIGNGYNMMALGGASFLFTSDGAVLKKWDRNTHALLLSVPIPGGQAGLCSGILADKCNNVFTGSINGVYRFDFGLVQKEFKASTAAVFDIAFSLNSDIIACGSGFLQPLTFGRESCGSNIILITSDPCNPAVNTVKVRPTLGIPPFSFLWDDGSTDSIRTNLPLGNHIIVVRDGACNPSVNIDTVKIASGAKPLTVVKTDPVCHTTSDGRIIITLVHNQTITSFTWTPAVNDTLLNDSTTRAAGLASGTYHCHLVSSLGCSFDTTVTITPDHPNPSAAFDDTKACDGKAMPFTDNSAAAAGGSLTAWAWAFGDGGTSLSQNPSHIYPATGIFPVTLIVTDNNGCKDTVTKNEEVHPLPHVLYTPENVCKGSLVPFTDLSSLAGTDVLQTWTWDFGDGSPVNNNQNALHLYAATGAYTTHLLVISNFGCRDSASRAVTINPYPVVNFSAPDTAGCDPLCVNFTMAASIASGSNTVFLWDFGDGSTFGAAENPNHCYRNNSIDLPKTFTVKLTVTSDSGCVTSLSKNNYITVNPNPIARFTVDPKSVSIMNPVINYTDLSLGAGIWNWNLGDHTASVLETPLPHTYADTGKYTVTLIVSNQYSCFDTAHETLVIEPDWAFYIPNMFSPNGDGINDSFQGYGYGLLEYEMFIFDRWGNNIFHTVDYDYPWDGKANGGKEKAQMDVYVYVINIKDIKAGRHSYKGIVTLVK